jgi:hypothetical protein
MFAGIAPSRLSYQLKLQIADILRQGWLRIKMQSTEPKIFNIDQVVVDFDEEHRILHAAYVTAVHPTTPEHLEVIFTAFKNLLEKYAGTDRIYLIVDMTNFIVEPELKAAYAYHAREIYEKYIYPRGVARYGYQITRITVRSSHGEYLNESPNIFNSREEAENYIHSLIRQNQHS